MKMIVGSILHLFLNFDKFGFDVLASYILKPGSDL